MKLTDSDIYFSLCVLQVWQAQHAAFFLIGEEIGLGRLEARPIATMCLEVQERHEKTERNFGGDED